MPVANVTDPRYQASLVCEKAMAAQQAGSLMDAENLFRLSLGIDPGYSDALHGLSQLAIVGNKPAESLRLVNLALTLRPQTASYLFTLGMARSCLEDLDGAIAAWRQAVTMDPNSYAAMQNICYSADLLPSTTPEYALALRRELNNRFCAHLTASSSEQITHKNRPDPNRRLRIGYVSADFRAHSAANAHRPIVRGHDGEQFETYLYSTGGDYDATSETYAASANWRDVSKLSFAEQAQEVADDRIDILVDLSGHTAGAALQMLACKPAPIQVTAWGYIASTGLDAVDVMFADAVTIPPELEQFYHEQVVRLPTIFLYSPGEDVPEITGPVPWERNGYLTFGYLGRTNKISHQALDAWAYVLRAVPDSRLLLKCGRYMIPEVATLTVNALAGRGVARERIRLQDATPRAHHLAAHNEIDIALDPMPQTGGMTTCDALLMGVPVVTKLGLRVPERVSASILSAMGRSDLIAGNVSQYVEIATSLRPRLQDRQAIRRAFLKSPLLQHAAYVKKVEAAYRQLWRAWCAEQKVKAREAA